MLCTAGIMMCVYIHHTYTCAAGIMIYMCIHAYIYMYVGGPLYNAPCCWYPAQGCRRYCFFVSRCEFPFISQNCEFLFISLSISLYSTISPDRTVSLYTAIKYRNQIPIRTVSLPFGHAGAQSTARQCHGYDCEHPGS
jgi:hypothetical protein